ncbi:MAG: hypothetical protein WBC22_16270 [Sedimentisphaerales bacterium]
MNCLVIDHYERMRRKRVGISGVTLSGGSQSHMYLGAKLIACGCGVPRSAGNSGSAVSRTKLWHVGDWRVLPAEL